jgi:hypothetical protein
MRLTPALANLLDAHAAGDEHDALYLIYVQGRRREDKAATYAHLDLLPLYILFRLP